MRGFLGCACGVCFRARSFKYYERLLRRTSLSLSAAVEKVGVEIEVAAVERSRYTVTSFPIALHAGAEDRRSKQASNRFMVVSLEFRNHGVVAAVKNDFGRRVLQAGQLNACSRRKDARLVKFLAAEGGR